MSHTPTGTVHFESQTVDRDGKTVHVVRVAVATVTCSCGHTATSSHAEDDDGLIAEEAAWGNMAEHLGYDPRATETGPESRANK